jgi:flagellar basal-body rod modification protein FlgD
MVSAVSSTTTSTTSAASSASSVLASDFDTFLQLLTTQLKNQDPTSPMDANEFTEQLVQFSQVEQQINMNKNLETMISMLQSQQSSNNLSYIGKVVDFDSNEIELAEGGTGFWSYDLPDDAATVQYRILDEDGNVVRSGSMSAEDAGAGTSGRIEVAWDGTDAEGNACDPGNYTLEVTAKDSTGAVLDGTNVYARGYVEAVETIDGTQYLIVSGMEVLPEDVIAVFDAGSTDDETDA